MKPGSQNGSYKMLTKIITNLNKCSQEPDSTVDDNEKARLSLEEQIIGGA